MSSVNPTGHGVEQNIEAGVLVNGGDTPRRAVEHLRGLREAEQLIRLD